MIGSGFAVFLKLEPSSPSTSIEMARNLSIQVDKCISDTDMELPPTQISYLPPQRFL